LCNFDSNVENITEVRRGLDDNSNYMMRQGGGSINNSMRMVDQHASIEEGQEKRIQLKNAFMQKQAPMSEESLKNKLMKA
jgi:hypothetical protein